MKLMVLGAPGAGKGTQAEIISNRYQIPIIGTGNLIREAIKNGSPIGKEIESYTKDGKLVPDEIVINMLKERMALPDAKEGYILDGFPRNVAQAKALEDMGIDVDLAINIHVNDDAIMERMTGRRMCGKCGSSYHIVYNKPAKEGICDNDGEELYVRDDDKPEVVKNRLEVYHSETEPLIGYYTDRNKLQTVQGEGTVDEITQRVFAVLEA